MASVRVTHTLGELQSDLRKIEVRTPPRLSTIVKRNTEIGTRRAQRFARASSGPHGRLYYKRITGEMTGPLTGEYGPTGDVVGNAVGAGWRHGPANTDLEKSMDIVGPKMAADVRKLFDRMFWP